MPPSEWTKMAIASAVAATAMLFLLIDAGFVDVNSSAIARRIEAVQASLTVSATGQHQLASAVQAWARRDRQKQPSAIE